MHSTSAAIVSDFVLILGFLSMKFVESNKAYLDFSATYSHKANTLILTGFSSQIWKASFQLSCTSILS